MRDYCGHAHFDFACATWLNKRKCFITVHSFGNSENIAVSMAKNVPACDVL